MLPSILKASISRLQKRRTWAIVSGVLFSLFISAQFISTQFLSENVLFSNVFSENLSTKSAIAQIAVAERRPENISDNYFERKSDSLSMSSAGTNSLQSGDRSHAVRRLQSDLRNLGYEAVGKTAGLFDSATEGAVRQFQRSEGLTIDGIAGPTTLARLAAAKNNTSAASPALNDQSRASLPPDIQRILDRGKLVVSLLNRDNPPFFMTDKEGRLEGSDVKMARAIAAALEVDIEFRRTATTFNEVVDDVYSLNADLAISKISRTLRRAKRARFSEPYLNLRQGLLVNRLALAQTARGNNMTEMIRNLKGKIGVIEGSSYEGFAKQKFSEATVVGYASWPEVVQAVTSGAVLAAYRDELEVKKIVLSQPDAALQFQTIALTDTQDPLSVVLPWDSEHLLAFVNQYLESSGLNYTTDSLLEEYADYFQP